MAHNIEIRDGVASFAYFMRPGVRAPWHGLGTGTDAVMTVPTALRLARAGFTVGPRELAGFTRDGFPSLAVDGFRAITRDDTDTVLGVQSDTYTPVQYESVARTFVGRLFAGPRVESETPKAYAARCDAVADLEGHVDTCGVLGQGERFFLSCAIGTSEIVPGDTVTRWATVASSHDGSLRVTGWVSAIRAVCQNTVTMGMSAARKKGTIFAARHTTNVHENTRAGVLSLERALGIARDQDECLRSLAGIPVTTARAKDLLADIFPTRKDEESDGAAPVGSDKDGPASASARVQNVRNRVARLFDGAGDGSSMAGVRGTAWGLYNAVAEWVDRESTIRGASKDTPRWLNSMLNTTAQETRDRALQVLSLVRS